MPGPFEGVRVLDFTMFVAGPYCTRLMADMGAEVIKVEPPQGDFLRAAPPVRDGRSAYFAHLNCGKKSISLDLKEPRNVDAVLALLTSCDVVLENFRPGVMTRLGLGYDTMRQVKPDLVYCSVTGYGQSGPNAARASFAPIIHAASGFDLLAMHYEPALERPLRNRNATADYLAATHAAVGIGAALFHRARSGEGQYIDVALMDVMHNAMSYEYVDAQFPGQTPAVFRPMRTSDGYLALAPVSEANFAALAEAAGHPEWRSDARFTGAEARVAHWEEMLDAIEEWTRSERCLEAEAKLLAAGCPAAAYRTIGEAQVDPHVGARGSARIIRDASGPLQVANCPIRYSTLDAAAGDWVAELGEHNEEYLSVLVNPRARP